MDDGTRTHDSRDHNPGLYQLSYVHHRPVHNKTSSSSSPSRAASRDVARPAGLEPATLGLEGRCSIRLSYGRTRCSSVAHPSGRGRGIRTPDPLLPKQMRYQTAPCPAGTLCRGRLDCACAQPRSGSLVADAWLVKCCCGIISSAGTSLFPQGAVPGPATAQSTAPVLLSFATGSVLTCPPRSSTASVLPTS